MIYDIIIIGAGPIGLLLANILGNLNIKTIVLEKENTKSSGSKAIGISPPSLEILRKYKLDETFLKSGIKVKDVVVHGTKNELGHITFNRLPSSYNFILSIPQTETENILEKNLKQHDSVRLEKDMEVTALNRHEHIEIKALNKITGKEETYQSKYLCACDGSKSTIRTLLNIPFSGNRYKSTFLMADFMDESGFDNEAHLFFTKKGPVESFPLPGKIRRWIVETDDFMKNPEKGFLESEVKKRTGIDISKSKKISESPFGVQHYIIKKYYNNKTFFCGDSAHVMSPIGGQGMNTGFADADFCANIVKEFLTTGSENNKTLKKYNKYRKKAALTATKRASLSMHIGIMKGFFISLGRNIFIYLFVRIFKKIIPPFFSMLTIPYNSYEKSFKK